tara:strand:+ start:868 stop:1776 length:909 start_codon:yes stop_codon:yes gene_type:complete
MIYIILLLSTIFCSSFSDVISFEDKRFYNSNRALLEKSNKKSPLIYGLYSAIIPGSGEYILHKESSSHLAKKRALIFFGLEIAAWISSTTFKNKYESQVTEYRSYANSDIGWDFERWIKNYDSFVNTDYEDLWSKGIGDGSHSIEFEINGYSMDTTESYFHNTYYNLFMNYSGDDFYGDFNITVNKDQHYYENIGKYNEFFSGWSDANIDNIDMITTEQGYDTARSPIKTTYLESYNQAEVFSDYAEASILCIYFNHFVSMIDAFILARKFNGDLLLTSSTVYKGNSSNMPIGVNLKILLSL